MSDVDTNNLFGIVEKKLVKASEDQEKHRKEFGDAKFEFGMLIAVRNMKGGMSFDNKVLAIVAENPAVYKDLYEIYSKAPMWYKAADKILETAKEQLQIIKFINKII